MHDRLDIHDLLSLYKSLSFELVASKVGRKLCTSVARLGEPATNSINDDGEPPQPRGKTIGIEFRASSARVARNSYSDVRLATCIHGRSWEAEARLIKYRNTAAR